MNVSYLGFAGGGPNLSMCIHSYQGAFTYYIITKGIIAEEIRFIIRFSWGGLSVEQ